MFLLIATATVFEFLDEEEIFDTMRAFNQSNIRDAEDVLIKKVKTGWL